MTGICAEPHVDAFAAVQYFLAGVVAFVIAIHVDEDLARPARYRIALLYLIRKLADLVFIVFPFAWRVVIARTVLFATAAFSLVLAFHSATTTVCR
ncbi:MAG TPA: hypothetical protein VGD09_17485 [Blastococcus sp.]|jgi:hypothetical protein